MSWQALVLKEIKEHVRPSGKWSGTLIAGLATGLVFGLAATIGTALLIHNVGPMPGIEGLWATVFVVGLAGLAGCSFAAILIPMNLGIDAIVGERERHTLETLLAGPLSDGSILWAKSMAIMLIALAMSVLPAVTVWITMVFFYAQFGLAVGLLVVLAAAVAPIVPVFIMTCWSFVFSIRAKTVKDAGQKMALIIIPFFLLPQFAISLAGLLEPLTALIVMIGLAVVLTGLSILGPVLAFTQFRRERLLV